MYDAVETHHAQHPPGTIGPAMYGIRGGLAARKESRCWFELDPTPVVLAAGDGSVLDANPAGLRALRSGCVCREAGGRLFFQDAGSQRAFDRALLEIASGAVDDVSAIVRCDDQSWRRIALKRCSPPSDDTTFIVFYGVPDRAQDASAMISAFGLTPAQGKILTLLSLGEPPKAIAAELGVSPHTVRAQLRSLYGKANVRGLCDLVRQYTRLTL